MDFKHFGEAFPNLAQFLAQLAEADEDLAAILCEWPTLPDAAREELLRLATSPGRRRRK